MDLGNCDGFPLLNMELDLSGSPHGGESLALCHRGGMMDGLCLCHRCVVHRRHVELVPFAWIRHHG
jgi:hypothetical protein